MIIPNLPSENSFQINRIKKLESEINIAIDWFLKNEMIINPDKFQAIFRDRKKSIDS